MSTPSTRFNKYINTRVYDDKLRTAIIEAELSNAELRAELSLMGTTLKDLASDPTAQKK